MKKLIFLYVFIGVVIITYYFPHTMINPGELVEAHQNLNDNCFSCHQPFSGISNNKCIECHKLSEIGKDKLLSEDSVSSKRILFHQGFADQNCVGCHTDHKGVIPDVSINKFEHSLVSKEIVNACFNCHDAPGTNLHGQFSTDCKGCHNTNEWKFTAPFNHNLIVTDSKDNCISCHQSPENTLHDMAGTTCNECHTTSKWKPATFNHNRILANTENTCVSCHQSPKDTFHEGAGTHCIECHTTAKWKPSTFNHTSYFVLDKHHNSTCNTCHINNDFKTYTCYGCHEHSETSIRKEHVEEGIKDFQDCVLCHRSGDEHDIRRNGKTNEAIKISDKEREDKSADHDDDEDDDDD